LCPFVRQGFHEEVGIAKNDRQEVVEIVRNAARQLADRIEFLRLEELLVKGAERCDVLKGAVNCNRFTRSVQFRLADGADDDLSTFCRYEPVDPVERFSRLQACAKIGLDSCAIIFVIKADTLLDRGGETGFEIMDERGAFGPFEFWRADDVAPATELRHLGGHAHKCA